MADPAFLFYPGDYLGGTMGFSLSQHGAYMLCLILQFNIRGPFTEDQARRVVGGEWDNICHKFRKVNGEFYENVRMSKEIEKREKQSEFQRKKAMVRWSKNDKPLSGKAISSVPGHCHGNAEAEAMPLQCMRVRTRTRTRNLEGGMGETKKDSTNLDIAMDHFRIHRLAIKKPASDHALDLARKKALSLAEGNEDRAVMLIDHAIEKGWQGVYMPKDGPPWQSTTTADSPIYHQEWHPDD